MTVEPAGENTWGVSSGSFPGGPPRPGKGLPPGASLMCDRDMHSRLAPSWPWPWGLVPSPGIHVLICAALTTHEGVNFEAETENAHETPRSIMISRDICAPIFLFKTQNRGTLFGGSDASWREFVAAV